MKKKLTTNAGVKGMEVNYAKSLKKNLRYSAGMRKKGSMKCPIIHIWKYDNPKVDHDS